MVHVRISNVRCASFPATCARALSLARAPPSPPLPMTLLSRFEVTRIIGIRSLQLSKGECPLIVVNDPVLKSNMLYVAALELYERLLDVRIQRSDLTTVDPRVAEFPATLAIMLDTLDGQSRSAPKRS